MNTRGYTVMEILVALFIFSLVLLPLTGLLVADSKFTKKYEQKQLAMIIAKNEIEKVKRSFKKPASDEYPVTMGGREWTVTLVVKEDEFAALPETGLQRPQIRDGLAPLLPGAPAMPKTFAKTFVTVKVSRPADTFALAEFRILKETYK